MFYKLELMSWVPAYEAVDEAVFDSLLDDMDTQEPFERCFNLKYMLKRCFDLK